MKPASIRLALACAWLLASLAGATQALAQAAAYPTRPLRIIVTFPPGGSSDSAARLVAPRLAERLGQPVTIENRPGAGGGIGLEAAAKSTPDGYTLVLASAGGLTANPSLYPKLNYDPLRDFAPVVLFGTSPFVLVVNDAVKAASARELIALAKARPGGLTYASGGNGTAMHLSGELLKSMTATHIVHIPYRGTAPAVLAAMSGETQLAIADIASVQQHEKGGRIRMLAVLSGTRSSLAPELPTLAEAGVPGYDATGWFAVLAPAGTPAAVVARLNADINAVLNEPEVRRQFAAAGLEPLGGSAEALGALMQRETKKWAEVIRASGAKVD